MDYKSLLKISLLCSVLFTPIYINAEPSDYDVPSTSDYDVPSSGDYDVPPASYNTQPTQNSLPKQNANSNMNPDMAEALLNHQTQDADYVKGAQKQAKDYKKYDKGAKVQNEPSVDQFGLFRPGVLKNSDGTQTIINSPSTPTDPAKYGAFVPKPPRAYDAGTPTGNLSNLQNTFISKKSNSQTDDEKENESNDN